MRFPLRLFFFCPVVFFAVSMTSSSLPASSANLAEEPADPHLWLEDVTGAEALAWVEARNRRTWDALAEGDAAFAELEARLRAIYDSDARIPHAARRGGHYYNFWRDARNPRGLWRRATPEEYRREQPAWEILLDLDALAAEENENWVWAGSVARPWDPERVLLRLSRGGGDAVVIREYDVAARAFVADGFRLAEGKNRASWLDDDTLILGADLGPGSMTASGYPRVARRWQRGQAAEDAELWFEGQTGDVSAGVWVEHMPEGVRQVAYRALTFHTSEYFLRGAEGWERLELPADASPGLFREWLLVRTRSSWQPAEETFAAGSLLAIRLEAFQAGERGFEVLYAPGERRALAEYDITRNHVVVNELDTVRNRLTVLTPGEAGWTRARLEGAEFGSVSFQAEDARTSDAYFLHVSDFLTPASLLRGEIGAGPAESWKRMPDFFETEGLVITQHEAVSADGTRVPYFEVGREARGDGARPTLLYGYGGFEVSMTPFYGASFGAGWLERGGVFVLANIRGGGEFGPEWHQAALREKRRRGFEDFIAVAEDLIRRGVTTPARLGIKGGSNGGLLVGAVMTQRPDLFGAVVCQVPLLDMRRYHRLLAGASWVAEYGDPDAPEDWAFLREYSPYHRLEAGVNYPEILLVTSTRDDRVHPGHARKFAARLEEQGHRFFYYENTEGGHGGAADNKQRARLDALTFRFLERALGGGESGGRE
jgi:prolyl oligopeptidase